MILSRLLSRYFLRSLVLSCCASACGDEDVTRVRIADVSVGVAPAKPDMEPSEPGLPDAGMDEAVISGPCGLGRRATYDFPSRFVAGASSVENSAAVLRHVLIAELGAFLESLTARVRDGQRFAEGELLVAAGTWLESSGPALADVELSIPLPGQPALVERRHADLASDGTLYDVIAGSDPVADHRRWSEPGAFVGFEDFTLGRGGRSSFSPRELVQACLEQIEVNAHNRVIGFLEIDPARNVLPLHVTSNGRDLVRLVQSFLIGAVAFSRGVDGELDDDVPGFGLLAPAARAGDAPFSALEHAWDMGFGYFGAARDYDREPPADASERVWFDTNADCAISLRAEVNFGAALGATQGAARDFGRSAFEAFVEGRRLIAESPGTLGAGELEALLELRNRAANGWERALAAASVHALNQLSFQLGEALASTVDYSFAEQARYWSELKGTSLAFQFNRRSPFSPADFAEFHRLIGDAPRVPDTLPPANGASLSAYRADLDRARDLLQATYGFDPATIDGW